MAAHCSILAWRIPWTEEPGGLQFMGLQRVRHNWNNLACMQRRLHEGGRCINLSWKRGWQVAEWQVAEW